jgi:uncharacterized protein involved in outer membrane biogenesis
VSSDAYQNPQPGRRREPDERPGRGGERRPLRRAGTWTREHWRAARARLARTPPRTRKALTWTGAIAGLLVIAIAILIAIWDWNWFRGPVERIASARMHREVTIDGDLHVHLFSWQPSATVDGVRIANTPWAGRNPMADIGRIAIQIRLIPLLGGHVDMRLLRFDNPHVALFRDAHGRANWDFSGGRKSAQPLRLPPIRDFVINNGQVEMRDLRRKLTFTGTLNASEQLGAQNHGFEMRGEGSLNRAPFTLRVTGGPLLNIDRAKPYPFDAYIRAGQTYVTAKGEVPKPFDLGQFHMATTARGQDLADVYDITGIALPNTPPYRLHGRISRDVNVWRVEGLGGTVGSSDLGGRAMVRMGGARPFLSANLSSRSLDFVDLGALVGGGPKVGKVASPTQVATARVLAAQQRLLPDTTLNVDRIRAVDADVTYKAQSIRHTPVNLRSGSAHVKLNDGLLRADPVAFELPQGRIAGEIQLNARKATPVTDLDLRLSNARLENLVPVRFQGREPFAGAFVGRAKLTGAGNSVHRAFANANGDLSLVVPNGEVRRSLAELMGVDVVKGLGLMLSKNQETTPIRCGVAHFRATNGVFNAEDIVFDTGPVLVTGKGSINMDDERLDLQMRGHPKKFQLVRVILPVTAQGTLRSPKLGVKPGAAIAQGGVAVALAAFLSPIAAILPFIDPGLGKDANCAALIADAKAEGAPVRTVVAHR